MSIEIQKKINSGDIIGLRYIFLDSLDVDPTFEKYEEDYANCKKINGFFEKNRVIHELSYNKNDWDNNYFEQIKMDLAENFSKERFEHMRDVAKVVYASKVERLHNERKKMQNEKKLAEVSNNQIQESTQKIQATINTEDQLFSQSEIQKREMVAKQEKQRLKYEAQLEEEKKEKEKRGIYLQDSKDEGDDALKKVMGIGVLVAVVVAGVIIVKAIV